MMMTKREKMVGARGWARRRMLRTVLSRPVYRISVLVPPLSARIQMGGADVRAAERAVSVPSG